MATEYDPMNNTQVNITGQLFLQTDPGQWTGISMGSSVSVIFNLYDRSVCDRIPDYFTNFRSYDDTELHFGNYGKSCTADEHVCHRYADEDPDRIFNYVFDHSAFAKHFKFCI